jgi:hypothetical protein
MGFVPGQKGEDVANGEFSLSQGLGNLVEAIVADLAKRLAGALGRPSKRCGSPMPGIVQRIYADQDGRCRVGTKWL